MEHVYVYSISNVCIYFKLQYHDVCKHMHTHVAQVHTEVLCKTTVALDCEGVL